MAQTYLDIRGVPGQKDLVRQYKVHVPRGYDPEVPAPAVFCIHGLGQTAVLFCVTATKMPSKADEEGFILIMPNGYSNSWNGGTCCDPASGMRLDDVALFRAILKEVGGGDIGLAIVGANSDTMRNTEAAWSFLSRLTR